MAKDYYEVLGVAKDSTDEQIRKAYKKLAMQWHPDKHQDGSKKAAEMKFKEVSEAYSVLSDPEKRQQYDMGGGDPSNVQFQTNMDFVDANDIFAQVFGSGFTRMGGFGDDVFGDRMGGMFGGNNRVSFTRGSRAQPVDKPRQYEVDLQLSLEEVFSGTTKKLKVSRKRWVGSQTRQEEQVLSVNVKAGWKDGTKVTFAGAGDQERPDLPPGDIVFVVKTKKHSVFARDGSHLIQKVTIPLLQALIGFIVPVRTLDGRTLNVRVDEVVGPTTRKIIAGEGLPLPKAHGKKGDLILEFSIQFPKTLTDLQKTQIEATLTKNQ
ncbi:MAG: uncharacterized protein KVP18_004396 [Porospora cf. gigantea A]|uniref:uncharacterized protein n=1 Tax=Porospora cf. gigantea A TaxID=2853593 RepID=UPI00355A20FF|nr:MAG: hypothetical protein KVP18_004396 [Porospora cf. gigantea A]